MNLRNLCGKIVSMVVNDCARCVCAFGRVIRVIRVLLGLFRVIDSHCNARVIVVALRVRDHVVTQVVPIVPNSSPP